MNCSKFQKMYFFSKLSIFPNKIYTKTHFETGLTMLTTNFDLVMKKLMIK